jgi:UDP-N-acetylglucosamine:LPS N-acetylglucosamine transferase
LASLFGDPGKLRAAAASAKSLGQPRAVEQLADLVEATGRGKTI